jgi:ribosomal-protein-serine acetyltransferase
VGGVTQPFGHDLGDGWSLTLRDLSTVQDVSRLIGENLDRLRAGEPWAWEDQSPESVVLYTEHLLAKYSMDQAVPCVLRYDGEIAGCASLAIDGYLRTVSLGYWVVAGLEGRGGVTRAGSALLGVARARGMRRAEIRAAVGNVRSRAVAERLGFELEGVLSSALPLGRDRVDVALYGLVLDT